MRPIIPAAPPVYDQEAMQRIINALTDVLAHCLMDNSDIRLKGIRLTKTDTSGGEWSIEVDTTGAIDTSTYP